MSFESKLVEIISDAVVAEIKGGPGSGNYDGPGQPRFSDREGSYDKESGKITPPDKLFYKCSNPQAIIESGEIKPSNVYGGVSLTANSALEAHGDSLIEFKKSSWFDKAFPVLYLEGNERGSTRLSPFKSYKDQFGNVYTKEEIDKIPMKLLSGHEGPIKGNNMFLNEAEWKFPSAIKFDKEDVIDVRKVRSKSITKANPNQSSKSKKVKVDKGKFEQEFRTATQKLEQKFQAIMQAYFQGQKKEVLASIVSKKAASLTESTVPTSFIAPIGISKVLGISVEKGGPGSGNYSGPGQPRFAADKNKDDPDYVPKVKQLLDKEELAVMERWVAGEHMAQDLRIDEKLDFDPDNDPNFKSALGKLPGIAVPIYRGVNISQQKFDQLVVGKEYEISNSESWSKNSFMSSDWATRQTVGNQVPVMFQLFEHSKAKDLGDLNPIQKEVILPKGSKLEVSYVTKMNDYTIVTLDEPISKNKSFVTKASPGALDDRFDFEGWSFDKEKWDVMLQKYGGEFIKELYDFEGNRAYDGLKYYLGDQLAGAFNIDDPNVQEFLDGYTFKFAQEINDTTEEYVRSAMKEGMDEGLGMDGIADLLSESGLFSDERAMLIARTETIRASNTAADMAYQQSGVVSQKEWLVTEDDRTCWACSDMQGEIIDVGDNFFDKGESLTVGEGDSTVSMKFDYEDVGGPPLHPNCRCALVAVIDTSDIENQPEEDINQDGYEPQFVKLGLSSILKGGPGSGNFNHEGRPGQIGGSGEGGSEKDSEAAISKIPAKTFDISSYPQDAKDISKEDRMAQAHFSDIKAQMEKDLSEIVVDRAELKTVEGKLTIENSKTIIDNMKAETAQYAHYLAGDTATRMRDYIDHVKEIIQDPSLQHLDAANLNSLFKDSIDKLMYQEIESNRQQFTDHGIRHLTGNIENQTEIMKVMGNPTAMDLLQAQFIMINHDVGYTTPLVRDGGLRGVMVSGDHKEFSAAILLEQKDAWNSGKIFSREQYSNLVEIVRTHDATTFDKNDMIGSATRLADNLSLFNKDKLPGMFKYITGSQPLLVKMGEAAKVKDYEAFEASRKQMTGAVNESNLSSALKRDLLAGVKDINYMTPKFTMGTLAGDVKSIGKTSDGRVGVNIKFNSWDAFLQNHFDMGQKQAKKVLEDYGITEFDKTSYDLGKGVRISVEGYAPKKEIGLGGIFLKGGPGSGSWNGPGDPRFAHEGNETAGLFDRSDSELKKISDSTAGLKSVYGRLLDPKDFNPGEKYAPVMMQFLGIDNNPARFAEFLKESPNFVEETVIKHNMDGDFSALLSRVNKFDSQNVLYESLKGSKDFESMAVSNINKQIARWADSKMGSGGSYPFSY